MDFVCRCRIDYDLGCVCVFVVMWGVGKGFIMIVSFIYVWIICFNFYVCFNKYGIDCKCRVLYVCDINFEIVEFVFYGYIIINEFKVSKL